MYKTNRCSCEGNGSASCSTSRTISLVQAVQRCSSFFFPSTSAPGSPDGAYELREFGTTKTITVTYPRRNLCAPELARTVVEDDSPPRPCVLSAWDFSNSKNCLRRKPAKDNGARPSASFPCTFVAPFNHRGRRRHALLMNLRHGSFSAVWR